MIWNPRHAPTALVLMLISFFDYKLYDKIYLGTYHALWHGIIILSPFAYFYYLGKHKRSITVNKTITIKHVPVHDPINQVQRPNKDRIEGSKTKKINQQEPYARHCGFDVRDAKTIDYTVVNEEEE